MKITPIYKLFFCFPRGGRKLCVGLCLLFCCLRLWAQPLYVSKYQFGNFIKDNNHYVEIFNESSKRVSLQGCLLVTRNYVFRFPDAASIEPFTSLRIAKQVSADKQVDVPMMGVKDFLIRFSTVKDEGDYIVLFDKNRNILDASYFSSMGKARFLPDNGELITAKGEAINFDIPPANNAKWNSLDVQPDPVMALVRINGKWQITSKKKNLLPATEFGSVQANFVEGIVSVKWQTLFETDCYQHILERSLDGERFVRVAAIPAQKNSNKTNEYLYYDQQIQQEKIYFYRLRNVDKFRNEVYSNVAEIFTSSISEDINIQVVSLPNPKSAAVFSFRFSSRRAQQVRIRLLNERFFEMAVLFDTQVGAKSENLVQYTADLPTGKYYLIAETQDKRYYKEIILKED